MANKTIITLIDDIDGSDAVETVRFGLDGKSYEIDLNSANAAELRKSLRAYVEAGRKASKTTPAAWSRMTAAQIREAAKRLGIEVPDRGRLSNRVRLKVVSAMAEAPHLRVAN